MTEEKKNSSRWSAKVCIKRALNEVESLKDLTGSELLEVKKDLEVLNTKFKEILKVKKPELIEAKQAELDELNKL